MTVTAKTVSCNWVKKVKTYEYATEVWRHTPWPLVHCHGCWFTHSQFHSRQYSLHITLKYTTLVRMRSGSVWTGIHDNGAEVDDRAPIVHSSLPEHFNVSVFTVWTSKVFKVPDRTRFPSMSKSSLAERSRAKDVGPVMVWSPVTVTALSRSIPDWSSKEIKTFE